MTEFQEMSRARALGSAPASAVAMVGLALAGCGADLGGGFQVNSITPYEASSAFSPVGHHVAALGDGRYRVTATGSAATPKARVEKIAVARAAEFGVEQKQKFFQTSAPQHSIRCGKRDYIEKGETRRLPARGYAIVVVDVVYANDAADASFRPTKDMSAALQGELISEVVSPEAKVEAARDVNAQCGV